MKTVFSLAAVVIAFAVMAGCDKQGPMGPPGEQGPDGANGSGGTTISFLTPANATIHWEVSDGWGGDALSELRVNDNPISLPGSLRSIIEAGGVVMVYFLTEDDRWLRLPEIEDARYAHYSYAYYFPGEDSGNDFYMGLYARVKNDMLPIVVKRVKIVALPASHHEEIELK